MMKGVAILLMIFLHLFNQLSNVDICHNLIFIDNTPLVYILQKASNPVPFFLILGGYGLFKVWNKGDNNRWWRIGRLYLHYWIVLAIFLMIGHYIYPEKYPGNIIKIVNNFTGFNTSYNGEMWFLFPYVILSLLSVWIFKYLRKIKWYWIIGVTLIIHIMTSFCISRYGANYLFNNLWLYNPLLVFHLLFSFCLGYIAARNNWFEKLHDKTINLRGLKLIVTSWSGIIFLVFINCVFKYNFFYAFLFISFLSIAPLPSRVKTVLINLGNQSMNMWMIHTWFCYYLFHDFIYSFKFPLLIFIILTVISYSVSLLVNILALPIERLILTRGEIKQKPIL